MQLSALQGQLRKRFAVQHQPAPVTPVHVPKRKAEDYFDASMQRHLWPKALRQEMVPLASLSLTSCEGFAGA